MRKGVLFKIFLLALCVGAVMLVPVHARAEEPGVDDGWQFAASIYLWGAGIDGKTQSDTEASISMTFWTTLKWLLWAPSERAKESGRSWRM
jgi:hypothetical protein